MMFGKENIYERFGGTKKENPKNLGDEWERVIYLFFLFFFIFILTFILKSTIAEWSSIKTLSLPEQEARFSEKLNDLFERDDEAKQTWQPLMSTEGMDQLYAEQQFN